MKITTFKKNVNLVKLMIENNSDIDHLKKKKQSGPFHVESSQSSD